MRHILLAGALILTGGGSALADPASEALFNSFIAWVDSSPEWSASAGVVRSEGDDTVAEGIVFGRENPQVAISIEELHLANLSARAGGGFAASEITLGGGGVVTEFMETTIPSATLAEVSLPSLAGLTFDVQHMMTSIARFYSLAAEGEIEQAAAPEITVVQKQAVVGGETVETRAVYRNLSFGPLQDGMIESQTLGPVSIGATGAGADFEMEIASISAERMDLAGMAHILDENAYRDGKGDGIWRPLLSRAGYSGLTGRGEDGAVFNVDEVVVENIDGRQPEEPFTGLLDRIIDPAIPQEAKNDLALEAVSTMFDAWRLGTMRLSGLSADAPDGSGAFSLESMTLSGVSSEKTDSMILKAMRAEGPDGFANLDTLEVAGFIPPDFEALMRFGAIEKNLQPDVHEKAMRSVFAALPRIAHFGLHGMSFGKSEGEAFSLGALTLDFDDWNDIFAQATDLRIEALNVPANLLALEGQAAEVVGKLGYENFVFGLNFSDRSSGETGADKATLLLTLQNAVDVALSWELAGLTVDWLMEATATAGASEDSEAAMTAMMSEVSLRNFDVKVTDRSLLDKAFAVAAEKQGLTIAGPVYRQQMRAALPFLLATVLPSDFAKTMSTPLQQFLEGGQTLVAEMKPMAPVGVLALVAAAGDPLALANMLNLTLSTVPAE